MSIFTNILGMQAQIIKDQNKEIEKLKQDLATAVDALEFYAENNWRYSTIDISDLSRECLITERYVTLTDEPYDVTAISIGGKRARQALAKIKGGGE